MKGKKVLKKTLSTVMAVLLILEILPLSVFASALERYEHALNVTTELSDEEKSPIAFEVTEEREENVKVYQREDGTYTVFASAVPIHYEENGEWKDIDNTLVEKEVSGKAILTNKSNSYKVEIPESLSSNSEIKLSNGESQISFTMRDITTSDGTVNNSVSNADDSELADLVDIESKDSAVTFENVRPNINVEYVVGADSLKESIILETKPNENISFEYELDTDGERAVLNSDSSITVYSGKEKAYCIESPYMFDSSEARSEDIDVTLTTLENGNYLIKYTPDYEWLNGDISYPVTIDPTTKLYRKRILNEELYGTYTATEGSDSTKEWFVQNYSTNYSELCFDVVDKFFEDNTVITSAKLSAYCVDAGDSSLNANVISAREITEAWATDTSTILNKSDSVLDYNTIEVGTGAQRYYWDITEAASMWALGHSVSRGIALCPYSLDRCNVKVYKGENNYAAWMPWLELDYKTVDSNREYFEYSSVDMGRAGTVNFNQYTGTFYLERSDLSLSGNLLPVSTGAIYDPWFTYSGKESSIGAYWYSTNFLRVLRGGQFDETVTDEEGNASTVTRTTLNILQPDLTVKVYTSTDETDSNGKVKYVDKTEESSLTVYAASDVYSTKDYSSVTIDDGSVTQYYDSIGRICKCVDQYGNENVFTYTAATSHTIASITDGVGRKYVYSKKENGIMPKMGKLGVFTADDTPIKMGNANVELTYTYTETQTANTALLTAITYPDGEQVKYEYNSDFLLTAVENIEGSRLEISYQNGRVSGYRKYVGNRILESGIDFYYESANQRVLEYYETGTQGVSRTEIIRYDAELSEIARISNDGEFSISNYDADGELTSDAYTKASDETELIANGDFTTGGSWSYAPIGFGRLASDEALGRRTTSNASCFKLNGAYNSTARIYQTVNGLTADEIYTVGAWAKGIAASGTNKFFGIIVEDANQNVITTCSFDANVNDWQFAAASFKATTDTAIVYLAYDNQTDCAYFDGVTMYKSENATVQEPEDEDWIVVNPGERDTAEGYNAEPCADCSCAQCTTANYDSQGNWLGYYQCHCSEEDELHDSCACLGCRQERGQSETKDSHGNILTSTTTNGQQSISTVSTYTADGNYLASSTDENGKVIYYNYNADTGLLDSCQTPGNTSANAIEYSYNAMGALTQISQVVSDVTMSTQYSYSKDRLTSVAHGGTAYTFEYNDFGNTTAVKLNDSTALVSYGYDSKQRNNSVTYANGTVLSYSYDSDDNITSISINGTEKYKYVYSENELIKSYDYANMISVSYDDGQLSEIKLLNYDETGKLLESPAFYSVTSTDDKTTRVFRGTTYESFASTEKYNSEDDTVTRTEKINVGTDKSINVSNTTDFFEREVSSEVKVKESDTVRAELDNTKTYIGQDTETLHTTVKNIDGEQSYEVHKEYQNKIGEDGNYYVYDCLTDSLEIVYGYDEANQVTSEVDVSSGTGYGYTYDANGNITSRTAYSGFTEDNLDITDALTVTDTRTYTYDSNWTDRLSAYNGETITYDSLGNPLTYKGATLTWQGRNLISYTTNTQRIEYGYNADNLRTTKKVYDSQDRLTKSYIYIWEDGQLAGYILSYTYYYINSSNSENGSMYVKYLYDENGEVFGMENTQYGTFLFVKDNFGNVIGIVDEDGDILYEFDYTAYGEVRILGTQEVDNVATQSEEDAIDFVNYVAFFASCWMDSTLVYKDYTYDSDTGMYYLQSRYYDPEVGRFINLDDTGILQLTTGTINGANLFAYCNNDPIRFSDCSGKYPIGVVTVGGIVVRVGAAGYLAYKKSLSVKMYLLTYINKEKNKHYNFDNSKYKDFKDLIMKRLKESTVVKNRIKEYKNKVSKNKPVYEKTQAINFYEHSLANWISDYDLHFSLGRVEPFYMRVQRIVKSGKTYYSIRIKITKELYNFEEWDQRSITAFINNNFGYKVQQKGNLRPYKWSVDFSFEVK